MKSHGDATYVFVGGSAAPDYARPLDVANLGPKKLTKSAIPVSECQDPTCFPLCVSYFMESSEDKSLSQNHVYIFSIDFIPFICLLAIL